MRLTSRAFTGMCPGHKESAGKRQSGRTRPANRYVKTALVQAAHTTARTQTYLGEQYRRLRGRRGAKRAAVAVGHSILVIFYHMMTTGEAYQAADAARLPGVCSSHRLRVLQAIEYLFLPR